MASPVFDSVSPKYQITSGTTISDTFNNVAGDIVFIHTGGSASATNECTGVTYNGVALIQVVEARAGTAGRQNSVWVWDYATHGAAPKGSNTMVATYSVSQSYPTMVGFSYNDFDTTDPVGASNTLSEFPDVNIDITMTTTTDESLFLLFGRDGNGGKTYTVTEGNIRLNTDPGGYVMADVAVPTAGAKTYTLSEATTNKSTAAMAIELKPAAAAGVSVTVTPATQVVTSSVPSMSVVTTGDKTVSLGTQAITSSVPSSLVETSTVVSTTEAVITISAVSPTLVVDGATNITLNPSAQSITSNVVSPTVLTPSESIDVSVLLGVQSMWMSTVPRTREGLLWNRIARTV